MAAEAELQEEFEEVDGTMGTRVRILRIAAGVVRFPPGMLRSSKAEKKPTQLVKNIAGYVSIYRWHACMGVNHLHVWAGEDHSYKIGAVPQFKVCFFFLL